MRCVIALMQHETNTFSPLETGLDAFARIVGLETPPGGKQAMEVYGSAGFAFSAMLDAAKARDMEISVPIAAYAEPSGRVDDAAFDHIADAICEEVARGCDAVLLDLHGAMATESRNDGEGELLRRIRRAAPGIPVAVALDFHTNLTREMVENASVIDGYRTYPHVDTYETGERAASTLFELIERGIPGKISWRSAPMMTHMILQTPSRQPMKDIMDGAIAAVDRGDVLNASVFGGFPLADVPGMALSVVCVEGEESGNGDRLARELCTLAWERRAEFVYEPESLALSVSRAGKLTDFPVVIADHGDNCGAGGSCDDMTVLAEMLAQGLDGIVAGPFWDPGAVEQLIAAGEDADVEISVGGKTDVPAVNQRGHSIPVSGRVQRITDGRFTVTGPMQTGLQVNLGRTAVLATGRMQLVLCEERWEPYDLGCFSHAGIDVHRARYILIKSRQHFRAGFEPIARHIVLAAGPGVCSSDYSQFEFHNLSRPIYPLDAQMSWTVDD